MKQKGLQNGLRAATSRLAALGRAAAWQKALHVFSTISEGLQGDLFLLTALCSACAKSNWAQAVAVLDISQQDTVGVLTGTDTALYNSVASALGQQGHWRQVMQHLAGYAGNTASMNCAVDAAGRAGHWWLALQWLVQMTRKRMVFSEVTFGTAVSSQRQRWQQALHVLKPSNIVAANSAISAMETQSLWQEALHLLWQSLSPTLVSFNSAMGACSAAGKWRYSLHVFSTANKQGFKLDTISYNSLINGCAVARHWELALGIFWQMDEVTVVPDAVSHAIVLDALPGLQADLVEEFLNLMRRTRCLDTAALGAALRCYGKTGRWEMSCQILAEVCQSGLQHDKVILGAAADACAREAIWEVSLRVLPSTSLITMNSVLKACEGTWSVATQIMSSMSQVVLRPDLLSHSAVSKALGTGRRWQELLRLQAHTSCPDELFYEAVLPQMTGQPGAAPALTQLLLQLRMGAVEYWRGCSKLDLS
ncbi:unnamed protein product [Durusdinium trenchii]|uniref:Pentatricopeptide repeat-containing protein, chloroplastic n=1 Tax=Durusdinium trenchii TaxID=1381693 RepID=A0ABP0K297_9DINO